MNIKLRHLVVLYALNLNLFLLFIGGVRNNVGVIGGSLLKNPGSMSSGCASDGSTDSLLEQDLHNLSLAVTQQALE